MILETFFKPKSVGIVGASRNPEKIGHVFLHNLIKGGYKGEVYPINPKVKSLEGKKCYASLKDAVTANRGPLDLVIMAVPAQASIDATEECGKLGMKNILSVAAGFSEIGNHKLEQYLKHVVEKYDITMLGPNCLGVIDAAKNIDLIFLPKERLKRPGKGKISFICQSGAVGSTTLDLLSAQGLGLAKFITYGNATTLNETHLLEFLGNDPETDIICMYIEGVRTGKEFIKVAKKVSKKKPIIALKGGLTKSGAHATLSHTASLAGSGEVYKGVFKQAGIIWAEHLYDLFDVAKILEKSPKPKGKRVQVITNGGGFGIMCMDALDKNNFVINEIGKQAQNFLSKRFPKVYVVHNPVDLTGGASAEDYDITIEKCLDDKNSDILLIVSLMQTPLLDVKIIDIIAKHNKKGKKPIITVITGGSFSELQKQRLEQLGVPCFIYPTQAVHALRLFCEYHQQ